MKNIGGRNESLQIKKGTKQDKSRMNNETYTLDFEHDPFEYKGEGDEHTKEGWNRSNVIGIVHV